MMAVNDAIVARILAQLPDQSRLSVFGGKPAVFGVRPVPATARPPYIAVSEVADPEGSVGETKTSTGREVFTDVAVYGPDDGDPALVDGVAEDTRDLFHRRGLSVVGYGCLVQSCSGVTQAQDSSEGSDRVRSAYGRVFTLRLVLIRA